MDFIPYNSRNIIHKTPFGAICEHEEITFRVVMPRNVMCRGVTLCIHNENGWHKSFPFDWQTMEGEHEEWWQVNLKIDQSELYFYHFEYNTDFGTFCIMHNGDCLGSLSGSFQEWQLLVYSKSFSTPQWLRGGLIYQIFPDRFHRSGRILPEFKDRIIRNDWGSTPHYKPNKKGQVLNNDFFAGDLLGIEQKLDYLKSLGVTCIYLNPIFLSHSNHRYDTADYSKIDIILGDETDFKHLCKSAEKLGISIVLDGVFSHTGDNSIYFNKYGTYGKKGAYQSQNSIYSDWFTFEKFPNEYKCWWGFPTLPEVNETSSSYNKFINGHGGIAQKWLNCGAKGWRLDVADELPDEFLDNFRKSVKSTNSDAIIIGEVWEDASNKCAYNKRRRYLQGDQLDSVMNYPFCEAIIYFAKTGISEGFGNKIYTILENYPKCVVDVLMNHIGTHDTARAITSIAGESSEYRNRDWQCSKKLTDKEYALGIKLLKIASAIQYTLPGVPSLYYGDEAGMQGYKDPFNRYCYPWDSENEELLIWYKRLGQIRKKCHCLKEGDFNLVSEALSCVCYERFDDIDSVLIIANRNNEQIEYIIPDRWIDSKPLLKSKKQEKSVFVQPNSVEILYMRKVYE